MNLLPVKFLTLMLTFAPLFSKRIWQSALVLMVGAILAPGKRTVTKEELAKAVNWLEANYSTQSFVYSYLAPSSNSYKASVLVKLTSG